MNDLHLLLGSKLFFMLMPKYVSVANMHHGAFGQ